jgi:L-rhamnose mutarotase
VAIQQSVKPGHVTVNQLRGKCRFYTGGAAAGSERRAARIRGVIRKAFRMAVNPGAEAEYERRHRPIWEELERTLIAHGTLSYSIFLDEQTRDLFGYVEIEDEARWAAIADTDVCRRWWRHMREIMPANPDGSPVSHELREVFHID